jgi:Raf kinase inhibitor-like YbhB/YbcL family protein
MSKFQLKSPHISNNGHIPIYFTCDGDNISPALEWSHVPPGTQSFVIIVDDPDAIPVAGHVVTHFAVINIDASVWQLRENQDFYEILPALPLENDHHTIGWTGPCPPMGSTEHSYRFTIYAVDVPIIPLPVKTKLTAEFFEHYFGQFILGKANFIGKYKRKKN